MRSLFIASFFVCLALAAKAQDPTPRPTDDRPIIIRQAPPDSLEDERDVPPENPLKAMTFGQRLLVGGGIGGLQFGNPIAINVAPMLGYQLTTSAIVGIGASYTYQSYKLYNGNGSSFRQTYSLMSLNAFARHQLTFLPEQLRHLYAQAEVEQFWGLNYETRYKPAYLIGAGINLGGFNITALYNVNYDDFNSPYSSPLVIRFGGFFTGPRF